MLLIHLSYTTRTEHIVQPFAKRLRWQLGIRYSPTACDTHIIRRTSTYTTHNVVIHIYIIIVRVLLWLLYRRPVSEMCIFLCQRKSYQTSDRKITKCPAPPLLPFINFAWGVNSEENWRERAHPRTNVLILRQATFNLSTE